MTVSKDYWEILVDLVAIELSSTRLFGISDPSPANLIDEDGNVIGEFKALYATILGRKTKIILTSAPEKKDGLTVGLVRHAECKLGAYVLDAAESILRCLGINPEGTPSDEVSS